MIIYFIGLAILLILGLLSLVTTKDKDCNVYKASCFMSALIFSLTSWIGLILILLMDIRRIWFEK